MLRVSRDLVLDVELGQHTLVLLEQARTSVLTGARGQNHCPMLDDRFRGFVPIGGATQDGAELAYPTARPHYLGQQMQVDKLVVLDAGHQIGEVLGRHNVRAFRKISNAGKVSAQLRGLLDEIHCEPTFRK